MYRITLKQPLTSNRYYQLYDSSILNNHAWSSFEYHDQAKIKNILFLKGIKLVNHEAIIDKDVYDLLYSYRMRMKWE
jgi:hypothetical protein